MDRLPRELIDAILQQCVANFPKNSVLPLRLVCRLFDRVIKPFACRTLNLEFSRLSRTSGVEPPQIDALQTIGYHCKSLYIDLMVLRDDLEVEFLETIFEQIPSMATLCSLLQRKYCMNDASFTESDFFQTVEDMLFNCRDVERLRLNLPFQFVGKHNNAATMILANTLKAFAWRNEEDSAKLKALVIENVTDIAICHLWVNPSDVMNIMRTFEALEHLVLTLRRHEDDPARVAIFGMCLWSLISHAADLQTLCLIGMDHDERPLRGIRQTQHWQMTPEQFRARSLPAPHVILGNLTCLELKRVEVSPELFRQIGENFGLPLEELFLNEVYLKLELTRNWATEYKKILWIGLPNQRPEDDCEWVAMNLRCAAPRLRVCRASFLAYDVYSWQDNDMDNNPDFDLIDPCGLGRNISQRFVEVVLGIRQPNSPTGGPVTYLPEDEKHDDLLLSLKDRPRGVSATECDTNAYQMAVANPTSIWHKSIDGYFVNANSGALEELHYIAETACQGMNEVHQQRAGWNPLEDDDDNDDDDDAPGEQD